MGEPNDYGYAVFGGFLVSVASSLLFYLRGRTIGFNSMVFSIISCDKPSIFWKITMIASMILASGILWNSFHFSSVDSNTSAFFDSPYLMVSSLNIFGFGLSGFLVGFGAKLSNGCTSGHLVCGIPRRSLRSLIAVVIYMISAFTFAFVRNDEPFLEDSKYAYGLETLIMTLV